MAYPLHLGERQALREQLMQRHLDDARARALQLNRSIKCGAGPGLYEGGSWDQDRIEECVEEAARRIDGLRADVERWTRAWQGADREWAKDRALGQWLVAEARAEVVRLGQGLEQWPTSTVVSGEVDSDDDPDRCGATEGATGVTCSLIRWHSLSVEHEGTASPEQEKSVGTPLFVRWPWNEYDRDWAVLRESSSDLLIQEGTRG
jgi:hypothetical protein